MTATELGLFFATLTAVAKGVQSAFQKHSAVSTDEYFTGWSSRFFGLLVLVPVNLYLGIPEIRANYFLYVSVLGVAIAATSVMIAQAYKESDVSMVAPIFATGPVLLLFTSFFMLGETSGPLGVLGVVLIAAGAYFLKIRQKRKLLDPILNLVSEKGVQLAFLVVLVYSITANIDKLGVQATSPLFWALSVYLVSSAILFPLVLKKWDNWIEKVTASWKPLLILGLLDGIYASFQMMALKLTLVSHVVALKRMSILISVVLGYVVFGEEEIRERLTGSFIMLAGSLLVYLSTT